MTEIRVERVSLRLRGIPVPAAQALASGLGAELARRLADGSGVRARGDVALGRVSVPRDVPASQLRALAAEHVARGLEGAR